MFREVQPGSEEHPAPCYGHSRSPAPSPRSCGHAVSAASHTASPNMVQAYRQDLSTPNSASDAPCGADASVLSTRASPGDPRLVEPRWAEANSSHAAGSAHGKFPQKRASVLTGSQNKTVNMEEEFEEAVRSAINFGDEIEELPQRWHKHIDKARDWIYGKLDSDKLLPYELLLGFVAAALFLEGVAWHFFARNHYEMTGDEVYGYDSVVTSMYFMGQVLTSAGVDGPEEEGTWSSVALKALYCVSLMLCLGIVAILVGFFTDFVKSLMEDVSKGQSKVLEQNHTLILGWSEATLRVLHQIAHMRETYYNEHNSNLLRRYGCRRRNPPASPIAAYNVVLANTQMSKGEMEDAVRYYFIRRKDSFKHTVVGKHIIFRKADPTDRRDLLRVGADKAASILVMMTEKDAEEEHLSKGTVVNGSSIHTVLALRKVILRCSSGNRGRPFCSPDLRVVVQLSRPCDAFHASAFKARNGSKVVYHSDIFSFLSKCLFSCATQPGLSRVLLDLLDAGDATIRKRAVQELNTAALDTGWLPDGIQGMTLDELQDEVDECVLIGIISRKRPQKGDGLLPLPERRLTLDDILVYVSKHEMPKFKSSPKCISQMVDEEHRRRDADRDEQAKAAPRKKQHEGSARRYMEAGNVPRCLRDAENNNENKDQTLVVFGWRKWWGTDTNRLQSVLRGLCLKDVFSKVVFLNQVEEDSFTDIMRNLESVKFNTVDANGAKVKVEMRRCTSFQRGRDGVKRKIGAIKFYKNGECAGQIPFDCEFHENLAFHGFEPTRQADAFHQAEFNAHRKLVQDVEALFCRNHITLPADEDLERVENSLKAMMTPNNKDLGGRFLCGFDRVTWEHVEGDPADVQTVEKLLKHELPKKPDVVVILSTQGQPEADEIPQICQEKRMLVIMLQLRHLLHKIWDKEGNGVHVVVENSLDQTAELALGPPSYGKDSDGNDNLGVAADFLNSQAIQARALCQALANPDIHSCVSELWDEQESNPSIAIMQAGEILGLKADRDAGYSEKTLAFGVVQQLVASARHFNVGWKEKHFAICVGYIDEATADKQEDVVLAPPKELRRIYTAHSRLVCFVRREDPDNERRAEEEGLGHDIFQKSLNQLNRPSMINWIKKKKDADRVESARRPQDRAPKLPQFSIPKAGARLRHQQPKSA